MSLALVAAGPRVRPDHPLQPTRLVFSGSDDPHRGIRETLDEFIEFNSSQTSADGLFHAVRVDIEPHAAADWNTISPEERLDRVYGLSDSVFEMRSYLDANGAAGVPLIGHLPVWYHDLAPHGGLGVGWVDAAERDDWFANLALDELALTADQHLLDAHRPTVLTAGQL